MVKRRNKANNRPKMKRFRKVNWLAVLTATSVVLISAGAWQYLKSRTVSADTIRILESKQSELDKKKLEIQKSQQTLKEKEDQIKKIESEKAEFEKQLQAKRDTPKVYAEAVQEPIQAVVEPKTYSLPENEAKAFIYSKESGNNPGAINSIGCRGLGQACPGDKLPCGDDYACQDAWFTQYAMDRYGSWEAAYNFWVNNRWW